MGRHDFEVDLQNMMGDVEESGGRLGKIVMNYLEQLKGEIAARKIHGG